MGCVGCGVHGDDNGRDLGVVLDVSGVADQQRSKNVEDVRRIEQDVRKTVSFIVGRLSGLYIRGIWSCARTL